MSPTDHQGSYKMELLELPQARDGTAGVSPGAPKWFGLAY